MAMHYNGQNVDPELWKKLRSNDSEHIAHYGNEHVFMLACSIIGHLNEGVLTTENLPQALAEVNEIHAEWMQESDYAEHKQEYDDWIARLRNTVTDCVGMSVSFGYF